MARFTFGQDAGGSASAGQPRETTRKAAERGVARVATALDKVFSEAKRSGARVGR